MTASSEPRLAGWRAHAHAEQERSLPRGSVFVSCGAVYGNGGLGWHLKEIVEALGRLDQPVDYVDGAARAGAAGFSAPLRVRAMAPAARVSFGWRLWRARAEFDAFAATRLTPAQHLIAFNRQALAQFRAARAAGYASASLMTGSPHLRRVARQHALALRRYPIERSFGTHVMPRYEREYAQADHIYANSRYTWESFVEQGVDEQRLRLFPLTPDARYQPREQEPQAGTFNVVYVGSLSVPKGVPLLIDAVRSLPHQDLRLTLVGGWKSRGMRRFVEDARARDPRIAVAPGDPLPHYREAALCVHATYEDGFAYAPAEALACGVPVLVSADTGMRELIEPGRTGLVLPTGDLHALRDAIDAAYRRELLRG